VLGFCIPAGEKCLYVKAGGELQIPCWKGLECVLESSPVEGLCYKPCSGNDDCPAGQSCIDKAGKKYCAKPGDLAGAGKPCGDIGGKKVLCIKGYQCIPERVGSSKEVCTKECTKNEDCKWPKFCNGTICTVGTVGTAKEGETCKTGGSDAETCDAGLACLSLKQGEAGKCYRDCKGKRADPCPQGTVCSGNSQAQFCLQTCDPQKAKCPSGYQCGKIQGFTPDQAVCIHQ